MEYLHNARSEVRHVKYDWPHVLMPRDIISNDVTPSCKQVNKYLHMYPPLCMMLLVCMGHTHHNIKYVADIHVPNSAPI